MKVVVVDAGLPDGTRSAGERAVVDQVDALVALGHAVTFVALGHDRRWGPDDTAAVAADLVRRGATVHPTVGKTALHDAAPDADVVVVHRPGPAVQVASALADRPRPPVVYAGHDLHADRMAAGTRLLGGDPRPARVLAVAERAAWRQADVVTYPTLAEAAAVRTSGGHPGAVAVPYYRLGTDDLTATDADGDAATDRRGLLMVGGAAHAPNHDAVVHVVADVLPRLRAAGLDDPVTVVGDWPRTDRAAVGTAVTFTGRVSDDFLRELHRRHRMLLAPLRFGAGAKRKLVAAMGLGLPVVTSTVGATGLLVRDAGTADGVTVADGPDAVAAAVATLTDPRSARAAARRARRAVAAVYGIASYDRSVATVLTTAVDGPRRST